VVYALCFRWEGFYEVEKAVVGFEHGRVVILVNYSTPPIYNIFLVVSSI
jgi:hypothetical protein